MRVVRPAAVLLASLGLSGITLWQPEGGVPALAAQSRTSADSGGAVPALPTPANVHADGLPPIPASILDAIYPYAQFRRARLIAWHPIERRMLITTRFGDAPQFHEVQQPGGARRQLTFFRDGVAENQERPLAAFLPDGRSFVFEKDVARGGEANQLFRYDVASGALARLTDGKSKNEAPVVSPRSGLVAYATTRRNARDYDIHVMNPADPSSDRRLAEGTGVWLPFAWSADEARLLALEVASRAQTYLWAIDVRSGAKTALSVRTGPPVRWQSAAFSPDGRRIYGLANLQGESMRVWYREGTASEWTPLTPENEPLEGFALSPDGRTLALAIDRGESSELRLADATGRPRSRPKLPIGVIEDLAWHSSGQHVAFSLAGARSFHDVYSVHVATGKLERWTWSEMGGANTDALPEAEVVRWKSFDGLAISGVLYRPPARFTGPRPVIINVHGGPDQRERPRGLGRSTYFRNELGIAVIYPNVRGSSGFGRSFEQLDNGLLRENAVKDIGALLDWIATQPTLDRTRVMIAGASYGGYVALSAGILYGDRLRGVNPAFGITDFLSFLESTDMSRQIHRNAEYGDPADPATRKFLARISPLTNAARLKIPVYIAAGAKDTRVPVSQAQKLHAALKANGTPVWYVVFQDAGHMQLNNANNDYSFSAWVLFVQTYLLE